MFDRAGALLSCQQEVREGGGWSNLSHQVPSAYGGGDSENLCLSHCCSLFLSLLPSCVLLQTLQGKHQQVLARMWEKGPIRLYCWECKLVQPLCRAVWRFLRKLKIELPYNPVIPFLGIYPDKTIIQKDIRLVQTNCGASLVAQMVKASAYNAGDPGLIPGSGRSPGEGNGTPLQYSCLENSMDRGAW